MALIGLGVSLLVPASPALAAQAPVGLGTAGRFSVLAGSGITNTGPTTVGADIGTFPTLSETGLNTMIIGGVNHGGDSLTQHAKTDLTTAYNTAAGATATAVPTELGGTTLTPGVYNSATLQITGTLTLDTLGDPSAVFIFQASSTLVTASNSAVIVSNGLQACNVYWQIGSSATLGTGTALIGTVLASASITATTGATVQGRLLALDGAVTLDTNTITNNVCATSGGATTTVPVTSTTAPSTTTPATTTTTTVTAGTAVATPPTSTTAPGSAAASSTGSIPGGGATTGATGGTTGGSAAAVPGAPGTPGSPGTNGAAPSTPAITTTGTARPPLAFTGFNPLFPLEGLLLLTAGIVLLGLSKRFDPAG